MAEKQSEPGEADAFLRRVFEIIADEAAENPRLMARLTAEIAALREGALETAAEDEATRQSDAAPEAEKPPIAEPVARAAKPAPKTRAAKPAEPADAAEEDELADLNPVATASEQGAEALRDVLRFIRRKDPLAKLAKRYALDVPQRVLRKRASVPEMVEAIVEATGRRVREHELSGG